MTTGGRYPFLGEHAATFIPTLRARALPGGPVTSLAYHMLKAEYLECLEAAMPLDAVYLDMHGAMVVQGLADAEADWFAATREVVGENCLIAVSFDLHANLTALPAMFPWP